MVFCLEKLKFLKHAKIGIKILGKGIEWTTVFAGIKKIREIKLRWFKTKICYRILVTNLILKDIGVVENNVCNFCLTDKDTILHLRANVNTPSPFGSGLRCV